MANRSIQFIDKYDAFVDRHGLRRSVYALFHSSVIESRKQKSVRFTIIGAIILSICLIIVASIPNIERTWGTSINVTETIILGIFALEYLLRIWSITIEEGYRSPIAGRLKYAFSFLAIVDLIAVLPFFIPRVLTVNLTFIRMARLVVLLRVLDLGKYSRSLNIVSSVLHHKWHDILASVFIILLLILCASIAMFYVEHPAQPEAFSSIPESLWWAVATVTTVGQYGHIFPVTPLGKMLSVVVSLLGLTAIGLPTGIIATGMMDEFDKTRLCSRCKQDFHHSEERANITL